ncbi:MAG: branched-chain amino acid ABC transporter ATP-binding protein/permease [Candidatus Dormibacteria bacterium]
MRRGFVVTAILTGLLLFPLMPDSLVPYDFVNTAILACEYLVVTLSLVLLIGLVGQISLAQASFVGMGAFVSALAVLRLHIIFPFVLFVGLGAGAFTAALIGLVALRVRGLFLAVATLIFAFVCDNYLFSQPWLVPTQSGTSVPPEIVGRPGTVPFFDLSNSRTLYYAALAVAVFVLFAVANVRDSRTGRAFAAVRGSEVAAASLGIPVTRFKLLAFATAGGLAGLGGALILVAQRTVEPSEFNFIGSLYYLSIAVVGGLRSLGGAIASSLLFAVLVGEIFFRIPAAADYLDLISVVLLISVLLFFRGGLGQLPARLVQMSARYRLADRAAAVAAAAVRLLRPRPAEPALTAATPDGSPVQAGIEVGSGMQAAAGIDDPASQRRRRFRLVRPSSTELEAGAGPGAAIQSGALDVVAMIDQIMPEPDLADEIALPVSKEREDTTEERDALELLSAAAARSQPAGEPGDDGRRTPWLLVAEDITVRFGGLTAVSGASIAVGAGEIVGLIGPNGAGKTTMFNSLLGLNQPATGRVELYGQDVTRWDVHRRAALGVGRTFQVLQLFGELSVYDNLLVATHLMNRTGMLSSVVATGPARRREREARRRVDSVLRLMGLDEVADRSTAELPFGVLRLVEVARTLVTGARLVCFDEPASGLDSVETERLIVWFRLLRQMGITLLVIEHDVSMVVRLCDYIYVLDQGELIAQGTPAEIQRDERVVTSYLGTTTAAAS